MLSVPRRLLIVQRSFSALANQKNATNPPHGPLDELALRIESGTLEPDNHQKLVTESLQSIYDKIQGYRPEPVTSGGFFGLFTSSKVVSNAPKGLYVHGSVGGGKTTLMDLFYDCCTNVSSASFNISII